MARVISPVWSKIRGTIAGITYLSGPGNPIIARQYVHPVNPNTPYQQMIRSGVENAVMQWENMLEAVREAWEEYATSMGKSGHGRRFFIGAYSLAFYYNEQVDVDLIDMTAAAPDLAGIYNLSIYQPVPLAVAGTGFQISVDNLEPEDDGVIGTTIAGPFNSARYKYKGPFSGASFVASVCLHDATTLLSFDELVEGGVYFVKIRGVTGKTAPGIPHRISTQFISRAIATVTGP